MFHRRGNVYQFFQPHVSTDGGYKKKNVFFGHFIAKLLHISLKKTYQGTEMCSLWCVG